MSFISFFVVCFSITFLDLQNEMLALRYVSMGAWIFTSFALGGVYFIGITTGGFPPLGDIEVYRTDTNSIFITWTDGWKSLSKAIKINRVLIMYDHLYVEESRRNFVFLPKELYPMIKSDH